jgi:hypothetical protein
MGLRAVLAAAVVVPGEAAAAQQPAPGMVPVTLTVEVRYSTGVSSGPIAQAFACVGEAGDPAKFGSKPTGADGRAVFTDVPFGKSLYVTADKAGPVAGRGAVQGKRIAYVAKSATVTVVLELPVNRLPGPNCATPIGQEPVVPPQKSLPAQPVLRAALKAPLKSSGGLVSYSRQIQLYTHVDAAGRYLLIEGHPSSSSVAVDEPLTGYTPNTVAKVVGNRMEAIDVTLPPGDGVKTIHMWLEDFSGHSETYTIQQQLADMSPCEFEYKRANGPSAHAPQALTAETLGRGSTRAYGGNGAWLRYMYNSGSHRLEFSFRSLDADGHEQGVTVVRSLEPNTSDYLWADLKTVRCF